MVSSQSFKPVVSSAFHLSEAQELGLKDSFIICFLKVPCAQIVCTLVPKKLYRDYFKAKVYDI